MTKSKHDPAQVATPEHINSEEYKKLSEKDNKKRHRSATNDTDAAKHTSTPKDTNLQPDNLVYHFSR